MNNDKLSMFQTEEEIRNFCRVNGYDVGLTNTVIARWKSLAENPIAVITTASTILNIVTDTDVSESPDSADNIQQVD